MITNAVCGTDAVAAAKLVVELTLMVVTVSRALLFDPTVTVGGVKVAAGPDGGSAWSTLTAPDEA